MKLYLTASISLINAKDIIFKHFQLSNDICKKEQCHKKFKNAYVEAYKDNLQSLLEQMMRIQDYIIKKLDDIKKISEIDNNNDFQLLYIGRGFTTELGTDFTIVLNFSSYTKLLQQCYLN